jgi:hypothetical protein
MDRSTEDRIRTVTSKTHSILRTAYTFNTTNAALWMAHKQDASFHKETQFISRNGAMDLCTHRHRTGIIIIIIYHLYAGYLQLCTWNKPWIEGTQCGSRSVFTIYATRMLCRMLGMLCTFFLHQHSSQYVCSAQYGCFLQFLNFVLSRYAAQILSERFQNGSNRPYYYYRYRFCFHIPRELNF